MDTNTKFTVIFSAHQAIDSGLSNLISSSTLEYQLTNVVYTDFIRAVGVYQGSSELSFVVHTNSANTIKQIARLCFGDYNQECILVSNNHKHYISLQYGDGTKQQIGKRFKHTLKTPSGDAYTVLNGTDYYEVN